MSRFQRGLGLACLLGASGVTTGAPADRVASLRGQLFTGPAAEFVDTDRMDPGRLPDDARIGVSARWGYDRETVVDFLRAAGIKWVRVGLDQDSDEVLKLVKDAGLNVLLMMGYGDVMASSPSELAEVYVANARGVLERHADVIRAAQIWNEPFNFPKVERGGRSVAAWPARYGGKWYGGGYVEPFGEFTARVAKALDEEYPRLFLVGGTKTVGSTLQILEKHSPPLDAIYLQPYPREWPPELLQGANDPVAGDVTKDWRGPPAAARVLERARSELGNKKLELWITEIGASTWEPTAQRKKAHHPPVTEDMQGRIFARVWATYMDSPVERVFYFLLNDARPNAFPHEPERNFSMVGPGWRPKPSYWVVARLNALTLGTPRPDPGAQVAVLATGEDARPRRVRVGSMRAGPGDYTEGVRLSAFTSPGVPHLVAVWHDGTLPVETGHDDPWPVLVGLPASAFGCGVVAVDPLTGASEALKSRTRGDRVEVVAGVPDYPLILVPKGGGC